MHRTRWYLAAPVLLVGASLAIADERSSAPPLTKSEQAVATALIEAAGDASAASVRQALREGLLSNDQLDADRVFAFAVRNEQWVDWRSAEDIFREYERHDKYPKRVADWLEVVELKYSPRAVRLRVYRRAIESGQAVLQRGAVVTRATALYLAALDGLDELEPLVDQYKGQALPGNAELLIPMMRLTSGAEDWKGGLVIAGSRLASLEDTELAAMAGSPGFQAAALQLAGLACSMDPYRRSRRTACDQYKSVAQRQSRQTDRLKRSGNDESRRPGERTFAERLKSVTDRD